MTPHCDSFEDWSAIEALFHELRPLDAASRAAYLSERCDGRTTVVEHVERLLRHHDDALEMFDATALRRVVDVAAGHAGPFDDPLAQQGAEVGPYRLAEQLASGGMGTVWRAERRDGQFDQIVAIKLIKWGMDSEELLQRFRTERQLLATLNHPCIARLIDGGTTEDGRPWLAMEFVDGKPIDAYCDELQLTVRQRLSLIVRICGAVHEAHRNLIVHRDLKPANILVTAEGEPKLLDFGIAKLLEQQVSTSMTRTGRRALTPRYASPEQIRGERTTTATDVYSLGIILYQLLTGRQPYEPHTESVFEIERAICEQEPTRPSAAIVRDSRAADAASPESRAAARQSHVASLRRMIAGDLDHIVLKAIAKAPDARYGSAHELADDIQRYLDGAPVQARGLALHQRFARAMRRNRKVMASTIVGVVVGLLLMTAVTIYLFLVPSWVNQAVTQAHMELLHPQQSNAIYSAVWMDRPEAYDAFPTEAIERAIEEYDSALRLAPSRSDLRLERDSVQAALDILEHRVPTITPTMQRQTPRVAQALSSTSSLDVDVDSLNPLERRSLGLIAMLTTDIEVGIASWEQLEFTTEPDPLVEGLMGIVLLAREEPHRAYPRLLSAYRALPEAGFLCINLADAAAHCGDIDTAWELFERAPTLPRFDDRTQGVLRVRADLLAASGDIDAATALYEEAWVSPVAWHHRAMMHLDHGEQRAALSIYVRAISRQSGWLKQNRYFLDLADAWWRDISDPQRTMLVQRAHEDCLNPDSFAALLFAHRVATLALSHYPSNASTAASIPSPSDVEPSLAALAARVSPEDALAWVIASDNEDPAIKPHDQPMVERILSELEASGALTPETRSMVDAWNEQRWRVRSTVSGVRGFNSKYAIIRGPIRYEPSSP